MLREDAVLEDWTHNLLWPADGFFQQLHVATADEDHDHLGSQKQLSSSPSTSEESCKTRPADKGKNIAQSDLSSKKKTNPRRVKKLQKLLQPMVALETRSDTDLLDDGYKWRKYGMKAAKNSKHPRSYYRCTIAGCLVKKRVERSTHDADIVVTTYQGMHNHYN